MSLELQEEVGLVMPAKFAALTTEMHIAKILKNELDLKNIVIQESKFPRVV